jgi:hypothetical protein
MRSTPQVNSKIRKKTQTNQRPALMLTSVRSPGFFYHLTSSMKEHQTFAFFSFIIISSILGVAVNWQHKQTKHNQTRYAQIATTPSTIQPIPFNPEYIPETLASVQFNQILSTQFKLNALQQLINQLDSYQQFANEVAYSLTDPSTPLGELGAKRKKRSRRSVPAYLNYSSNKLTHHNT